MATRCSSPQMAISGGNFNKKPGTRVFMLHNSHFPPSGTSTALIRSFSLNKVFEANIIICAFLVTPIAENGTHVFEDQSRGIVCYRDDRGEVICEGYDEGPRFRRPALQKVYHRSFPRHFQILDFLQATRLLEDIVEKGAAAQED